MLRHVLEMLGAMTLVWVGWAVPALLLTGVGLCVRAVTGKSRAGTAGLGSLFWLGLAVTVAFVQLWHLLLPVTPVVWVVLACVSLAGFALAGRGLVAILRSGAGRHKLLLVAALLAAVWLSNRAIGPCRHTDSGLYHLQVVRWYRQYPAVPGLGNLHWRYASNNANLLLAASVEAGPLSGRSAHVLNSLLIYAMFVYGLFGARRLFSHDAGARARGAFDAMLPVMAVQMSNHWMVSSHSTDVLPAVCSAVAASQVVAMVTSRHRGREAGRRVVLVLALLAAAVCGKLTAAPFAVAAGVAVIGWWLWTGRRGGARTIWAASAAVAMLLIPWVIHGVILSGWAFCPIPVIQADVDWAMPADMVRREWDYIGQSGRAFGALSRWSSWAELAGRLQRDVLLPAAVAVVAAGALVLLWIRRRTAGIGRTWIMLPPAVAGIAAWLAVSPQRRLGFYLVWIFAASLVAMLSKAAGPKPKRRTLIALLVVWAAIAAGNLKKVYTPPVVGGFHATPTAKLSEARTACGQTVFVPEDGFCWDSAIPCTPHVHPNLRLRKPGDLSAGFRIKRTDKP